MTVYHGLFNSIATYSILTWGLAYNNAIDPILNIQKKIFNLINTVHDKMPLNIIQNYTFNSLMHNYEF